MLLHAKIRRPSMCGIGLLFHSGTADKKLDSGAEPPGSRQLQASCGDPENVAPGGVVPLLAICPGLPRNQRKNGGVVGRFGLGREI